MAMFKAVRLRQATHETAKIIDAVQLDPKYYEGERNKDELPHGFGKYSYVDGDVYEGYWENGFKHGKGKIIQLNTFTYQSKCLLLTCKRNMDLCEWRSICW